MKRIKNKNERLLVLSVIIFIIFSMTGCDIKRDGIISEKEGIDIEAIDTIDTIDTQEDEIKDTDSSSYTDWKNYFSEVKYDRNVLDIKIPNEYIIHIEFDPA